MFLVFPQVEDEENSVCLIPITSKHSLVRIGDDPNAFSEEGKEAANLVWDAIVNGNLDSSRKAIALYSELVVKENYGGDHSALMWFCERLISPEAVRDISDNDKKIEDKLIDTYYAYFSDNDFAHLREFLQREYGLDDFKPDDLEEHKKRHQFLEDFIMFNNPKRDVWECTQVALNLLDFKEGDRVADIGCGFGYYSFRFSKMVGEKGRIFAIDINKDYTEFVEQFAEDNGINNITTVHSDMNDVSL
jgi:hypothetical protein